MCRYIYTEDKNEKYLYHIIDTEKWEIVRSVRSSLLANDLCKEFNENGIERIIFIKNDNDKYDIIDIKKQEVNAWTKLFIINEQQSVNDNIIIPSK